MTEKQILYVMGALLGVVVYFMKRWLNKVDKKLDKVDQLSIDLTVMRETRAHMDGNIEVLTKSIADVNRSVGKLGSSVTQLWVVVEANQLKEARFSDKFTGTE